MFTYICRNGSIINIMDLGFRSTSVPSTSEIANVLINAASNITAFSIDVNSIVVDGERKKNKMQLSNLIKKKLPSLNSLINLCFVFSYLSQYSQME